RSPRALEQQNRQLGFAYEVQMPTRVSGGGHHSRGVPGLLLDRRAVMIVAAGGQAEPEGRPLERARIEPCLSRVESAFSDTAVTNCAPSQVSCVDPSPGDGRRVVRRAQGLGSMAGRRAGAATHADSPVIDASASVAWSCLRDRMPSLANTLR